MMSLNNSFCSLYRKNVSFEDENPSASRTKPVLLQHIVVIHCVLTPARKPCNVIARTDSGQQEKFTLLMSALFFTRGEQRGSVAGASAWEA